MLFIHFFIKGPTGRVVLKPQNRQKIPVLLDDFRPRSYQYSLAWTPTGIVTLSFIVRQKSCSNDRIVLLLIPHNLYLHHYNMLAQYSDPGLDWANFNIAKHSCKIICNKYWILYNCLTFSIKITLFNFSVQFMNCFSLL